MGERGRGWWMEERCPRKVDEEGALSGAADLPDRLGTGGVVETRRGWGYVSMGARPNRRGFISLWILYTGIPYAPLPKIQVIYSRALLTLGACILSSNCFPRVQHPCFPFWGNRER